MSSAFPQVEAGLEARVLADPRATDLLSRDEAGLPRFSWGFPTDVLSRPSAAAFPRVTYYRVPGGDIRRPGFGTVRVRIDIWVWPSGSAGGIARLSAIDAMLTELLDEQGWIHDSARLYAVALPAADYPSGLGAPMRRLRQIDVSVSPAA